jgi:hypothetical protein
MGGSIGFYLMTSVVCLAEGRKAHAVYFVGAAILTAGLMMMK